MSTFAVCVLYALLNHRITANEVHILCPDRKRQLPDCCPVVPLVCSVSLPVLVEVWWLNCIPSKRCKAIWRSLLMQDWKVNKDWTLTNCYCNKPGRKVWRCNYTQQKARLYRLCHLWTPYVCPIGAKGRNCKIEIRSGTRLHRLAGNRKFWAEQAVLTVLTPTWSRKQREPREIVFLPKWNLKSTKRFELNPFLHLLW